MSRIDLIEQLYEKTKEKQDALSFDFDKLKGPAVNMLFSQSDIDQLYQIATSIKLNANIDKKYELIDNIMRIRGFYKAHCGTNRAIYYCYENKSFIVKVALDKVALKDSLSEFKNQELLKPFCCKIFDVHPSGVIAVVERVNPITSIEEFASIAEDIFNMMITKIIGKYVVDDLGSDKYMNYGLRHSNGCSFGPVVLDYPYVYELDGSKLFCQKQINTINGVIICNGEIDYDKSLSHLVCTKCGKTYKAMDLEVDKSIVKFVTEGDFDMKTRARLINKTTGEIIYDSARVSDIILRKDQIDSIPSMGSGDTRVVVTKNKFHKPKSTEEIKRQHYTDIQVKAYNNYNKQLHEDNKNLEKVIVEKREPEPKKTIVSSTNEEYKEEECTIKSNKNETEQPEEEAAYSKSIEEDAVNLAYGGINTDKERVKNRRKYNKKKKKYSKFNNNDIDMY